MRRRQEREWQSAKRKGVWPLARPRNGEGRVQVVVLRGGGAIQCAMSAVADRGLIPPVASQSVQKFAGRLAMQSRYIRAIFRL